MPDIDEEPPELNRRALLAEVCGELGLILAGFAILAGMVFSLLDVLRAFGG